MEPVTLDSDMNAVLRITDKQKQKLQVVTSVGGESLTKVYSLANLRVANA